MDKEMTRGKLMDKCKECKRMKESNHTTNHTNHSLLGEETQERTEDS